MSLPSSIAHYRITAKLGEGGMGEVYRATDTKLNRDVAIKVIPEAFAADAARMARFAREAQVLASLNHPNIAAIYGVEERALVLELVEGPTLAERIGQGPMPAEEAIPIACQIAEAMEYAHERGVIHRDLKPANIKLTGPASGRSGRVKVLDFGLAKLREESQEGATAPTRTMAIAGTPGYLAPEQLQGKPADSRSDIFAFGCVLYELLTGRRAFPGNTLAASLASTAMAEPKPIEGVPRELEKLLRRCLRKDPSRRAQSMADVRVALEDLKEDSQSPEATAVESHPSARRAPALPWAVAAVLAVALGAAAWVAWRATRPVDRPLIRLDVNLGPDAMAGSSTTVAISPDGRRLVYPVRGPDGRQQLATRLLDQPQATLLAGTEDGYDPFFSPDSQWIGFAADLSLKKISVQGGAPVTLCHAYSLDGGSWGDDGNIVASLGILEPLSRLPASGGPLQRLTKLAAGEATHRWPQVLPGGKAVLFTSASSPAGMVDAAIQALDLRSGAVKVLQRGGYYGRYIPGGYLVYVNQGVLYGERFDAGKLQTLAAPQPLLEDVAADASRGGGQFDFSPGPSGAGMLVYLAGAENAQRWPIVWMDSSGKTEPLLTTPGIYFNPRFSPDGRRLALDQTSNGSDIFVYDLARGAMTRLTFDGHSQGPIWSPDGARIAFRTNTATGTALMWTRSDGAGEPRKLLDGPNVVVPWSFSPDGRRLAYFDFNPDTGNDIWTLPLDPANSDSPRPGKPQPYLRTPAGELVPTYSPDRRWIAYRSDSAGTSEIYVRPAPNDASGGAPAGGGKWQVSTDGGVYAIWAKNGRELFYERSDHRIMALDYTVNGDSFVPGQPRPWSDKQLFNPGRLNLDLAPDGKRFAVFQSPEASGPAKGAVHAVFLLNFLDELKRRLR
jgi:serine/threonine-protein kinase